MEALAYGEASLRTLRGNGIRVDVVRRLARVRAVRPRGAWREDDCGYVDAPLTPPLDDLQIAEQFPTLGLRIGTARPHVRGKIREYLPL